MASSSPVSSLSSSQMASSTATHNALCRQEPPHPPLIDDLKLTILSSSMLYPAKPTERRSMFLSIIDQVLNHNVETIHFFAACKPGFGFDAVVDSLRSAVEQLLVPYDFLAGRLRVVEEEERLEIDCNRAGVGFTVAKSELCFDELGDLEYPNPAFRQLAYAGLPENEQGLGLKMEDQPLCSFQVTSFKCGGLAMGIFNSHATLDGISFKAFLHNLASLSGGGQLVTVPFTDRRLLSPRSPSRVTFPHPELVEASIFPNMIEPSAVELHFRLFRLSATDIAALRLLVHPHASRPTSFNVVVSHIWRCKLLSYVVDKGADPEKVSTMIYAVDIRGRLCPPLPAEYTGNAVLTAYAEAKTSEVMSGPLGRLVEAVAEGSARMGDEYARSVIDWGNLHRGYPKGDMLVSSWWRLGFADVEYPWGKPIYTCPVAHPDEEIVLLFPGIAAGAENAGVNVLVALPKENMEKFADLFYKLLPNDV